MPTHSKIQTALWVFKRIENKNLTKSIDWHLHWVLGNGFQMYNGSSTWAALVSTAPATTTVVPIRAVIIPWRRVCSQIVAHVNVIINTKIRVGSETAKEFDLFRLREGDERIPYLANARRGRPEKMISLFIFLQNLPSTEHLESASNVSSWLDNYSET